MNIKHFYQVTDVPEPPQLSFGLFAGFATIEQLGQNRENALEYVFDTFVKLCFAYGHLKNVVPMCIVHSNAQIEKSRQLFDALKYKLSALQKAGALSQIALEEIYYLPVSMDATGLRFDLEAAKQINMAEYNQQFFERKPHIVSNHLTKSYHISLLKQWAEYTGTPVYDDELSGISHSQTLQLLANKSTYFHSIYQQKQSPLKKVDTLIVSKDVMQSFADFEAMESWYLTQVSSGIPSPSGGYFLKPVLGAGGQKMEYLRKGCQPRHIQYQSDEYLLQPDITNGKKDSLDRISVNFCIHKQEKPEVVNASVQLYSDPQCTHYIGSYFDTDLSLALIDQIGLEELEIHAEMLKQLGVSGPFGMDFIKNKYTGEYNDIIDCNLRMTASTPVCLLAHCLKTASEQIKQVCKVGNNGIIDIFDLESTVNDLKNHNLWYSETNPKGVLLIPNMVSPTQYDPVFINIQMDEINHYLQQLQLASNCKVKQIYF